MDMILKRFVLFSITILVTCFECLFSCLIIYSQLTELLMKVIVFFPMYMVFRNSTEIYRPQIPCTQRSIKVYWHFIFGSQQLCSDSCHINSHAVLVFFKRIISVDQFLRNYESSCMYHTYMIVNLGTRSR